MAQSIFPFVERIVGVDLRELLLSWQTEGLSFRRMSMRLRDDYDVDVTGQTISRWLTDPAPNAVAS